MTIKELIAELSQYDENTRVEIFDESNGIIDITDIFKSETKQSVIIS